MTGRKLAFYRAVHFCGLGCCMAWPAIGLIGGVPGWTVSWSIAGLCVFLSVSLLWRLYLESPQERRSIRQAGTGFELRGGNPPLRPPKYGFGARLLNPHGFVGDVDAIYADFWSAVESFAVPVEWFEMQTIPPSTRDQVFYGIIAPDGKPGASLVGEQEARWVRPAKGEA